MFRKRIPVTYIQVTESRNCKGIDTYFNTDKLKTVNEVYKDQLLSIFVSGINILSEGTLTVGRVQPETQEVQKNEPRKSK